MHQRSIDAWLATIMDGGVMPERDLRLICEMMKEILIEESNVQYVSAPVTIVGDLHGQFQDLLTLFKAGGEVPKTRYVFMGDYVDRGSHSVETFTLLMLLKLKYPQCVTVLRGNHESRNISRVYGFYDEICKKYGNANPWRYFNDMFDYLPVAAVVEGKIFCIHGGLSPDINTLDQLNTLERRVEIPIEGPLCDLFWSDPDDVDDWYRNQRGAGYVFGETITDQFNHLNGLNLIARAHQLVMTGYKHWFSKNQLVTVWSVPNYCYRCGNQASIMKVDENLNQSFTVFETEAREQPKRTREMVPYFL